METLNISSVLLKTLPSPGQPGWYFSAILLTALACFVAFQYFDYKKAKLTNTEKHAEKVIDEDDVEQARRQAGQNAHQESELKHIRELLTVQFSSLQENLEIKMDSIKEATTIEIRALEKKVDKNQEQGDHRLARLEQSVNDGFREVYSKINKQREDCVRCNVEKDQGGKG